MLQTRSAEETLTVAVPIMTSAAVIAGATHAWIAAPAFGLSLLLRFALQPPMALPLTRKRRVSMALLGWSAIVCFIWAIGVRLAHWPG